MSEKPSPLQRLIWHRDLYRNLRPHLPGITKPRPADAAEGPLFPGYDDGSYDVSLARLEAIEDALARGAPIDERMREELRGLLAFVAKGFEDDAKPQQPSKFEQAATVLVLRQQHGLSLKEALSAVIPNVVGDRPLEGAELEARREAVKKAAARLEQGGKHVQVLQSWVDRALARHRTERTTPPA